MHVHTHTHRPPPFAPPVVRLDGVEITPAEIAAEMQHHPAAEASSAWQQAAEALVVRRLLLNEASRQGIDATPEGDETAEDAQVRRLLAAELRVPHADEATCRRWYEANRARFRSPDAWQATHLLIAADPADPPARAQARARAEDALAQCMTDPGRLADLATALSDCPSRGAGGDLGLVEAGSTVAEFEAALRATPQGALHEAVVETRFGFHVIRVQHHEPGRQQPFEAVQPRIAAWLQESAWRRAAHQYMALLAARAQVEGLALSAGADGPLVQ
jgi:peptidyl-prolyl cis-trans isomerase C